MKNKIIKIMFHLLLALTLFSYWAGFALLFVNKLFYKDLPAYTIGRICIWEYVAIIIAFLIAKLMIKRWGNIKLQEIENKKVLTLNPKYGIYFGIYFLIALIVGIWQFWLFSKNF